MPTDVDAPPPLPWLAGKARLDGLLVILHGRPLWLSMKIDLTTRRGDIIDSPEIVDRGLFVSKEVYVNALK